MNPTINTAKECNKATSADRYARLVELTRKLTGIEFIPDGYGPWEALIRVWDLFNTSLQCNDVLYATLHCIKWGTYPQSIDEPLRWAFNHGTHREKDTAELMALFYEELTSPGAEGAIELHAWTGFKGVFHRLSNDNTCHIDHGSESHSWVHKEFLNNRFDHLVHSFDPTDDRWLHYKWFENVLHDLLPCSITWSEKKWLDERFILQEFDCTYGTNFQTTPDGLTHITHLFDNIRRNFPVSGLAFARYCTFTFALAKAIWPVDTIARITDAYKAVVREARQNERYAKRRKTKTLGAHEFGYADVKTTGIHQLVSDLISSGAISNPAIKQQAFEMQFSH